MRDFTARAACRAAAPTVDARRTAAHDAFAYWTPLNATLLPLLQQYQTLLEREGDAPRAGAPLDVPLSPGELAIAALDEPAPLLQALEERFRLSKAAVLAREAPVADELLAEAGRDGAAHFELMCVLYHSCDPDLLPYFVALVDAEAKRRAPPSPANSTQTPGATLPVASPPRSPPPSPSPSEEAPPPPSFFDRALNALPLLGEWSKPTDAQVLARAKLLFGAQCAQDGVELLLKYDLWDAAVAGVRERTTQDAQHCDLFHALLDAALRRRATDRFADLWALKPLNYAALDLFEAVQDALPPPPATPTAADILATGDNALPLSAFFPRLADLVNAAPF